MLLRQELFSKKKPRVLSPQFVHLKKREGQQPVVVLKEQKTDEGRRSVGREEVVDDMS